MSTKDLNECSGCLIINNDENIALPAVGDTAAYDVNFDKPCFFVNKHYISPVEKCYNVKLPNPVSLEWCDKLRINIKIPKNIFGENHGYSLEDLAKTLRNNEDFRASLRFKSSDGCWSVNLCASELNELDIVDYCGWINITIHYEVGRKDSRAEICNLCEIGYSLCFPPIKLKTLYGSCHGASSEVAEFKSETCLEIENVEARREANIGDAVIEGPEDFLCLTIIDDTNVTDPTAEFDKFTQTLTVTFNTAADTTINVPAGFSISGTVTGGLASAGTTTTSYIAK